MPAWQAEQAKIAAAKEAADKKAAADKATQDAADKAAADAAAKADADAKAKATADADAATKAAADAKALAAAPVATTNLGVPGTPSVTPGAAPLGAPIETGAALGDTTNAGTGDLMSDAVLTPPKYWVGGLDAQESAAPTGRTGGAMKTTQT